MVNHVPRVLLAGLQRRAGPVASRGSESHARRAQAEDPQTEALQEYREVPLLLWALDPRSRAALRQRRLHRSTQGRAARAAEVGRRPPAPDADGGPIPRARYDEGRPR